jgi:predicted TIM-barrel fold metal-dependent hydrolase
VMWGSNYPNTHDRSYPELVEFARRALDFLSGEDRDWVFGGSALRLWPELGN